MLVEVKMPLATSLYESVLERTRRTRVFVLQPKELIMSLLKLLKSCLCRPPLTVHSFCQVRAPNYLGSIASIPGGS